MGSLVAAWRVLAIALLGLSLFAADALAGRIDVALFIEKDPRSECSNDLGYSKLFHADRSPDGKGASAHTRAKQACTAATSAKHCDVRRFTVVGRRELNTHLVVVKASTPCGIDGTTRVTYGIGAGLGVDAARAAAVKDIGHRNWSWSSKKHGYEVVETLALTPKAPAKKAVEVSCKVVDEDGGTVEHVDRAVEVWPVLSPSGKLIQVKYSQGTTTTSLSAHKLRRAQKMRDKEGRPPGDADVLVLMSQNGKELIRLSGSVLADALCGKASAEVDATLYGRLREAFSEHLDFVKKVTCQFDDEPASCLQNTQLRTRVSEGSRG